MSIAVYKVGGSLLSLPDLASRLRTLTGSGSQRPLLVSGGGAAADVVRDWDRCHDLMPAAAHELAILSLHLTDALLCTLVPECQRVGSRSAAEACWNQGRVPVLDVRAFLESEQPASSVRLPCDWTVTSDAIAAWVAIHWPADRLVLLKSCDIPARLSWEQAARKRLVDACFPSLVSRLKTIAWVNLRTDAPRTNGEFLQESVEELLPCDRAESTEDSQLRRSH